MVSLKETTKDVTLSAFAKSHRVNHSDSTLFHVQDPNSDLWGLFHTSKGLIIPCEGVRSPEQAAYGFWLIKTDDLNLHLFNPETTASTPRMPDRPRQINERFALADEGSITYLVDTERKTVYGRLTPEFEKRHIGFIGMNADIPSQKERHCWIWLNESTFTMLTSKESQWVAFVLNIETGENSTTPPIYMA